MLRVFVEDSFFLLISILEPQTTSYKWLFQLDDSKSLPSNFQFSRNIVGWPAIPACSVTTGNITWDQAGPKRTGPREFDGREE